jgi:23S rRNA (uracil1939-C5)-methyltransferase
MRSRRARPVKTPRAHTASAEAVATMTIDSIAAGGDGVGRVNGLAVFVPRTAPGDVAQVAYRVQGRMGRGRLLQLLSASPHRAAPACVHYDQDQCGGCQLQHLDPTTQQHTRRTIVRDALKRLGKRDVDLPTLTSDVEWGYRGRLALTLQRKGAGWIGGLHPYGEPRRIFALEECRIAHPELVSTWHAIRPLLRRQPLSNAESMRLSLRLVDADANAGTAKAVALVFQGGSVWSESASFAAACGAAHDAIAAIWWQDDHAHDLLLWQRVAKVPTVASVRRRDVTHHQSRPAQQRMSANATKSDESEHADYLPDADEALAFAQVNAVVAASLRRRVEEAVLRFAPTRVVDGYAGTGALSVALVRAGVQVIAIEAERAGANAIAERLDSETPAVQQRLTVHCGLVEEVVPSALQSPPDVVVLNPPRRGVDSRVTGWLNAASPGTVGIVYVSCNPATLARDLARLSAWSIQSIECFDMFPQTSHVETVCVLTRTVLEQAT